MDISFYPSLITIPQSVNIVSLFSGFNGDTIIRLCSGWEQTFQCTCMLTVEGAYLEWLEHPPP